MRAARRLLGWRIDTCAIECSERSGGVSEPGCIDEFVQEYEEIAQDPPRETPAGICFTERSPPEGPPKYPAMGRKVRIEYQRGDYFVTQEAASWTFDEPDLARRCQVAKLVKVRIVAISEGGRGESVRIEDGRTQRSSETGDEYRSAIALGSSLSDQDVVPGYRISRESTSFGRECTRATSVAGIDTSTCSFVQPRTCRSVKVMLPAEMRFPNVTGGVQVGRTTSFQRRRRRRQVRLGAAMNKHRQLRLGQRGQAMVEFLVVSIVVVPLFVLVPLIGKYLDIKQSSIAASRKLAFECTVRYEDCASLNTNPAFADEIRTRFFSGNGNEVLSNDRPAADALDDGTGNPMWVDRQGRPLLERFSDVGVRADQRNIDVGVAAAANAAPQVGPDQFGLDLNRGMFDARVQVRLSRANGGTDFIDQLDSLALNMQHHTAILTNAWTAAGPGSRGDRCRPNRNTVNGRASEQALCMDLYDASEPGYQATILLMTPLAMFENNSIGEFDFHDFMDQAFADDIPNGGDPVGFPRLERR